jgi:hypothetical protein
MEGAGENGFSKANDAYMPIRVILKLALTRYNGGWRSYDYGLPDGEDRQ